MKWHRKALLPLFFSPRVTSCFPCLNPLIFSTDPMFHSSWASWKVHLHSHFHLLSLHFCSLAFPAYLWLSAILSHPLLPAWRTHPDFLAVKPKHKSKPELRPHSTSSSIKLKDLFLEVQLWSGTFWTFALSVSDNFEILLAQLFCLWADSETISIFPVDVYFNSLIPKMKKYHFY